MLRTLYRKFAIVLLVLFGSIGVLYMCATFFTARSYLQEVNQKVNRTLARDLVRDRLLTSQGEVNREALKELFHMLMVINPNIEIYLLDQTGSILAFSAAPEKVRRTKVDLAPILRFVGQTDAFPILGDDPRNLDRQKVFSVSPIPLSGEPEGYLYIVLGGEQYDSAAEMLQGSYIVRLSLWAVVAGLLFALMTGLLIFSVLTRRVRHLASIMETFAKSDFSEQMPPHVGHSNTPGDEIDRLEATFKLMAERILQQVGNLKQIDFLRRELVANVSHDLRTPLASLHGYLETLLIKEGRLTPNEQRQFVQIAVKQSERLRRLVEELFELAKLDSHEAQVQRETFSLGELVQDVTRKFQLEADRRQIRLQTYFKADLPFVMADIRLMERVLENLIQNAIEHTPSNGTITVALSGAPDVVTVKVVDTGSGISDTDLPYVFERFYRGHDSNRSHGAGLGLGITKKILELHGAAIDVQSNRDIGTTMSFQLRTS